MIPKWSETKILFIGIKLNVLSLITMIIAIPYTIIYNIIYNPEEKDIFSNTSFLGYFFKKQLQYNDIFLFEAKEKLGLVKAEKRLYKILFGTVLFLIFFFMGIFKLFYLMPLLF